MQKRMWMWQGAIVLLTVLGPTLLGVWLSFKFATARDVATQRENRTEAYIANPAYREYREADTPAAPVRR